MLGCISLPRIFKSGFFNPKSMDSSDGSRPDPDREISRGEGGGGCPKNFFPSFVQQFSVTIRGGGGGAGPSLDLPLDSQYMHNFKTGSTKGTK